MCQKTSCGSCEKATWTGCGKHIDTVCPARQQACIYRVLAGETSERLGLIRAS